jgi:hypothetical protein
MSTLTHGTHMPEKHLLYLIYRAFNVITLETATVA